MPARAPARALASAPSDARPAPGPAPAGPAGERPAPADDAASRDRGAPARPVRYVMVSSEIRRDLEQPLEHFERLEIHHLYNRAPWKDMRSGDFGPRTRRFLTPIDLFFHLARVRPDVIQGPEPFSLLMFPYLVATWLYLLASPRTRLITLSLEPIPLGEKYHPLLVPVFESVLRPWFRRASAIFWFDRGSFENLLRHGAPEENLVNQLYGSWGVDLATFRPDADVGPDGRRSDPLGRAGDERPSILYVGRLAKVKGVTHLIEAFRLLRGRGVEARLDIVGDGAEREELEAQAAASGVGSDIRFHGLVKNADLPPYMAAADAFALPSITSKLWVQQLSMTAWQAMACGLPVVATDTGQMAEFTPEGTGLLVPERDPAALADALEALVADDALRARMSAAALAYARDRFDTVANVRRAEATILRRCGLEPAGA